MKHKRENYSAVMLSTSGPAAASPVGIDVHIDRFTTDAEVKEYAEILAEGGSDQLRKTLEKVKVGTIAPTRHVGMDIAIARAFDTPEGRRIRVVTARYMSFVELYRSGRSTDYPFGLLEFTLNPEGKGEGTVLAAFKPKFTKEGQLEIEGYGHEPLRLVNVRQFK